MLLTTSNGLPRFTLTTKATKMPAKSGGGSKKGTQPNHHVTDGKNTTKYVGDAGVPMSKADKEAFIKGIDKMVADSRAIAKAYVEKQEAEAKKPKYLRAKGFETWQPNPSKDS